MFTTRTKAGVCVATCVIKRVLCLNQDLLGINPVYFHRIVMLYQSYTILLYTLYRQASRLTSASRLEVLNPAWLASYCF
jgi:hypothetical protein